MKQFPLIVFDAPKVMQLLYACAYARAAAVDACIVDEPAIFNKSLYLPQRVGSLSEGHPAEFKRGVMEIYKRYQAGFEDSMSRGSSVQYLESCVRVRDDARQRISQMHEYVNKHNTEQDDALKFAFHTTNAVRAVCTVALATGAVVLGTPGALVFTGYKVASGFATASDNSRMGQYKTAYGLAIGKVENNVISVGDAAQEVLNAGIKKGLHYISMNFLKEMRTEFARNRQVVLDLERQIQHHAGTLMRELERKGLSKTAEVMKARLAQGIVQKQAELAAARSTGAQLAAKQTVRSGAMRMVGQGIPIVFLANDVISAYNEWYDAENQMR